MCLTVFKDRVSSSLVVPLLNFFPVRPVGRILQILATSDPPDDAKKQLLVQRESGKPYFSKPGT